MHLKITILRLLNCYMVIFFSYMCCERFSSMVTNLADKYPHTTNESRVTESLWLLIIAPHTVRQANCICHVQQC